MTSMAPPILLLSGSTDNLDRPEEVAAYSSVRFLTIQRARELLESMAWRKIDQDGVTWHVQAAAEWKANAKYWRLMLSFRPADTEPKRRAIWAPAPIESDSKSSLFQEAERLTDETLKEMLVQTMS